MPEALSKDEWIEEHEWLLYALLHEATAVACTRKYVTGAAQRAYDGALKSLLAHTHDVAPVFPAPSYSQ